MGKSLWMERDGLQVAVLRTERRHSWPFELTLVARHTCLRDFANRVPPPRSREPSEFPVKAPPSDVMSLVKRYRSTPYNLGRFPSDEMNERRLGRELNRIGRALEEAGPL